MVPGTFGDRRPGHEGSIPETWVTVSTRVIGYTMSVIVEVRLTGPPLGKTSDIRIDFP